MNKHRDEAIEGAYGEVLVEGFHGQIRASYIHGLGYVLFIGDAVVKCKNKNAALDAVAGIIRNISYAEALN